MLKRIYLNCRMSPRRTTERDVPETDSRDGRHRRMSLRREAETDGPSVFMSFYLGDIRLRHSSWPSQSRRRTSPRRMPLRRMSLRRMSLRRMSLRRMSPRRRKAETEEDRDGCPRDRRCVFLNMMEGLSACYCLIIFEWCVWVEPCVMTCVDHSSGVCGCGWLVGWVCMGACGGGGDGRKSMFCRGI